MEFVENSWYVASWSGELGRALKAVKILGHDIVLYRRRDGTAVALVLPWVVTQYTPFIYFQF